MWPDFFNDNEFSLLALTAFINETDTVPGRAGELAFAGSGEGVSTLQVSIERIGESLSLIQTTPRHAPAPQETRDKATIRAVAIPQVKLEDTIPVSSLQDVRQLGSTNVLRGARTVIDQQIIKMGRRHDLTLENLRLGALRGVILDADGSTIENLFTLFGVTPPEAIDFDDVLEPASEGDAVSARLKGHEIVRHMKRNLKAPWPSGARVHAFAGDNFFDKLIESTKGVWNGWAAAEQRLGANYAFGVYEFGGVLYENYQGTDDNTTVAVGTDDAMFFPVGVPGLYVEYYAPADFQETAQSIGLPRYAKIAPDGRFNRSVYLHTQQNPLPLCTRPRVLLSASIGSE